MATMVAVPTVQQPVYTTVQVVYPTGVAYRNSPNYGDRVQNVPGPTKNQQITGRLVQGDVQYLELANQYGGNVYVPMQAPNGQQLAVAVQMPPAPPPPMQAPPPSYGQPPTGYAPQPYSQPQANPQVRAVIANDLSRVRRGYRSSGGGYCSDSSSDDCHSGYRRHGRRGGYRGGGGCHGGYRGGHGCHC
eukprot:TRINITY_DN18476_c0_g1_i3.p2 TRINITY_DN18476_c0_g1~~TRINITY_DN18476_c0_g1_i3.p2  ORF type:complete len:189 (+),score=23.55 TRINITY_DN18476_c0_g1_i3:246-812(+)